jgi:hypothetical protein
VQSHDERENGNFAEEFDFSIANSCGSIALTNGNRTNCCWHRSDGHNVTKPKTVGIPSEFLEDFV